MDTLEDKLVEINRQLIIKRNTVIILTIALILVSVATIFLIVESALHANITTFGYYIISLALNAILLNFTVSAIIKFDKLKIEKREIVEEIENVIY